MSYEIYQSDLHNEGVRSLVDFSKDEIVFQEKPLHFLQTLANKQDVLVCSYCMKFLGGGENNDVESLLQLQLDILTRKISRQTLNDKVTDYMIYPCGHKCGEYYCSSTCCELHWNHSHCLLCTGSITDEQAENSKLLQFKIHAIQSNEIFLLCAEIFAKICLEVELMRKENIPDTEIIEIVLKPYNGYVRNLWWEAAVAPKGTNPVVLRKTLMQLVHESWGLLKEALSLEERNLENLLSEEYFSRTIGMFEQNNVGVRLLNPIQNEICKLSEEDTKIVEYMDATDEILIQLEDQNCGIECDNNSNDDNNDNNDNDDKNDIDVEESAVEDEKDDDNTKPTSKQLLLRLIEDSGGFDSIFPPLDGTAFYSLICKINHSCIPNVMVKYATSSDFKLHVNLFTVKNIQEGEEFVQCYIDQDLPYSDRVRSLQDYGFQCKCSKCLNEE